MLLGATGRSPKGTGRRHTHLWSKALNLLTEATLGCGPGPRGLRAQPTGLTLARLRDFAHAGPSAPRTGLTTSPARAALPQGAWPEPPCLGQASLGFSQPQALVSVCGISLGPLGSPGLWATATLGALLLLQPSPGPASGPVSQATEGAPLARSAGALSLPLIRGWGAVRTCPSWATGPRGGVDRQRPGASEGLHLHFWAHESSARKGTFPARETRTCRADPSTQPTRQCVRFGYLDICSAAATLL